MLNPHFPAAVVAGNVETSTCITNALYGALGVMAAGQCTMNNFTFGNAQYQYYETISGGSGAGPEFDGTSVVQIHMTNSRLTDPEVLEFRFPVRSSPSDSRGLRRRRPLAGRRRRRAADSVPGSHDRLHLEQRPALRRLRLERRRGRRGGRKLGRARGRAIGAARSTSDSRRCSPAMCSSSARRAAVAMGPRSGVRNNMTISYLIY